MKYITLGASGTRVPAIGQGTGTGYGYADAARDSLLEKTIRAGIDAGATLIDTAENYFQGHAEELVGRAIKGKRSSVFVATKFAPEHNEGTEAVASAERSLKRLNTDYIDLYQLHWPNPEIPLESTCEGMLKLVGSGKARNLGVCNLSLRQLKEAKKYLGNALVSLQTEYNLEDRSLEEELLPWCRAESINIIAYSPLQGRGGNLYKESPGGRALEEIAREHGKSVSQIILNWIISHPNFIAIPGTTNSGHAIKNAEAGDFELTKNEISRIEYAFPCRYSLVPTDEIRVVSREAGSAYQTVEEAIENKLKFVPGPADLAEDIKRGDFLKPVKLVPAKVKGGRYKYDLVGGKVRYWAWVIAHRDNTPIRAYIENNQ